MKRIVLMICLLQMSFITASSQEIMDLSGQWGFQTDITDFERAFENSGAHRNQLSDKIVLPGTTDTNKKGLLSTSKPINRLSRIYEYVGPAWYQKEIDIPVSWNGKSIELFMERILWISSIYVDGILVGDCRSFSTPHSYNLSSVLTPGKHHLAVCIDNRVPAAFDKWSHAFSEYTQTAWNGIVGKIELRAYDALHINDIQVYPNIDAKTVKVVCTFENQFQNKVSGTVKFYAETLNSTKMHKTNPVKTVFSGTDRLFRIEAEVAMGEDVQLWDEFSPILYQLVAEFSSNFDLGGKRITFGMRKFSTKGAHFMINNRKTFLRGTLECAVFPLTAYPDMTTEGWLRICNTVKEYGLNHIRFHSWCPPEAAFVAANQSGVYLQVELPAWTDMGKDTMLNHFFNDEMDKILLTYGNHPSFVMLCVGNELRGDFSYMASLISRAKQKDTRHIYSGSTARTHLPEDQFYVSHMTSAGSITTYGARGPQTDYDLRNAYEVLKVPGVAHEVGQRAVYPDFDEIKKYTGVLYPLNFELFRDSLEAHGMLHQASDFFKASGQMTSMLYKESIEALLRTPNCGGFQLLDLHDFPGQGTALVGILDAFWDSKGIIAPEKFREFCSPTVPLLRLNKRTFFNDEKLSAQAELCHYGDAPLKNIQINWEIRNNEMKVIESGKFKSRNVAVGSLDSLGNLSAGFSKIETPQKLTISIFDGQNIKNSWEIWVYPKKITKTNESNFLIAKTMDAETIEALNNGKNVLLLPDIKLLEGKQPDFQNHFWCPVMFRWEPMTMGALVNNKHPLFENFESDFYTNWQWWDIINYSKTLVLEGTPKEFSPILQIIDTYDRCLKEGVIFEAKVGKGKLLMASIDFETNIDKRPASQQLLYSIKKYMAGAGFNPSVQMDANYILARFKKPNLLTGAKIILCDSYETGNEAEKAIDDDPNTIWHTAYSSPGNIAVTNKQIETDYPHQIQIELDRQSKFKGFTYIPRKDGTNGMVAQYEFYISNDGKNWGNPVSKGTFARNSKNKDVVFEKVQDARFIRFVALKGFDNQKWTSMAELKLIGLE